MPSGCADVFSDMLNQNIVPIVPSRGAVGAAGSAPLSHIPRVACGYGGEAWKDGVRCLLRMQWLDARCYRRRKKRHCH